MTATTPVSNDVKPDDPDLASTGPLTPKQLRFVAEYMVDMNAAQAAIRAGYSAASAKEVAYQLLHKPSLSAEISRRQAAAQERLQIKSDVVLREAYNILTADPRELVEHWVHCCRHCYGLDFKYQRTVGEHNRDRAQHELNSTEEFDSQGGIGFDPRREPNPDCPECFGKGEGRTYFNDTRRVSAAAASLYAGMKKTKDGHEVRLHDKLAALEKLMKHLGLFNHDNTQKNQPLQDAVKALIRGIHTRADARIPIVPQHMRSDGH